jgi:hypothetical protein
MRPVKVSSCWLTRAKVNNEQMLCNSLGSRPGPSRGLCLRYTAAYICAVCSHASFTDHRARAAHCHAHPTDGLTHLSNTDLYSILSCDWRWYGQRLGRPGRKG